MATAKKATTKPVKAVAKKTATKATVKAPAKAVAVKAVAKKAAAKAEPTHAEISALAHKFYNERGGHHGSHHADWLRAEKELKG